MLATSPIVVRWSLTVAVRHDGRSNRTEFGNKAWDLLASRMKEAECLLLPIARGLRLTRTCLLPTYGLVEYVLKRDGEAEHELVKAGSELRAGSAKVASRFHSKTSISRRAARTSLMVTGPHGSPRP